MATGAEQLKTFLTAVDTDREEWSGAVCVDDAVGTSNVVALIGRFIDEVIAILSNTENSVQTYKQFASLKTDDITWPIASASGGHKVLVRMAMKKIKAEAGSIIFSRLWLSACTWNV